MNRSVLIVICDFLLVSLLAFSTVDINRVGEGAAQPRLQVNMAVATNQPESGKDLSAVMRLALEEEQKRRELLLGELARTREVAGQREKEAQTLQQEVQAREQEAQRLQQQRANLQQQFLSAQTNVQTLSEQVRATAAEALISKERLAAMEAELRKRAEEAAALQQQLSHLAQSNQAVLNEKQKLAGQLQVAEVEKRHATEQVARMQEEVKVEREEKAKLAEGVKVLASKSGELTQEIRENRPLASNTIFNEFATNRIEASFSASRSGAFGNESTRRKATGTVLVTDGSQTFALCHVEDTPLTLWNPGTDWARLSGTLARNTAQVPIRSVSFHFRDPRVVLMPVSAEEARQLGGKAYRISSAPFKFQDAVLVGAGEGYYGECRFEIDLTTPEYVKLDRSVLKGLFGKFNPSRGDLVFSKTGEFLGIMANNTYCLMLHNFEAIASFQFGADMRDQHTGLILGQLHARVLQMPLKLQ